MWGKIHSSITNKSVDQDRSEEEIWQNPGQGISQHSALSSLITRLKKDLYSHGSLMKRGKPISRLNMKKVKSHLSRNTSNN